LLSLIERLQAAASACSSSTKSPDIRVNQRGKDLVRPFTVALLARLDHHMC
jgi:hypothetical protein